MSAALAQSTQIIYQQQQQHPTHLPTLPLVSPRVHSPPRPIRPCNSTPRTDKSCTPHFPVTNRQLSCQAR